MNVHSLPFQIDSKYREFSALLQTIHSQIPFVKTEHEIVELIGRIDTFITNNEPRQLEDLKSLAVTSKRLYGYDKTIEIYSSNIELFQSFFTIKSELRGLIEKLRFADEQKQRQQRADDERKAQELLRAQEQQLRDKEEQRLREHRMQEELRLHESIRHQEQLRAQEQLWAEKQLRLEQELHAQELLLLEEKRRAQEQQIRLQEQLKNQELRLQEQLRAKQLEQQQHQQQQKSSHQPDYTTQSQQTDHDTQFSKTVLIQSTESHSFTQNNINEYYSINEESSAKQAPIFTQHLCDATVQEGDSFTFKCCVIGQPMPSVEWFKDGIPAKNNPDYRTTFDNGLCTLSIDETLADDSATFICRAKNCVGSTETKCRLVVKETDRANILIPPNFIKLLETCAVVQGSPFELRCKVEGNPLPTVQWFRNMDCIDHTHQHGVTYNNGEAVLRFDSVQLVDDAVYTCKASNMMGFDQTSAKLNVIADSGYMPVPNGLYHLFILISSVFLCSNFRPISLVINKFAHRIWC